MASQPQGLAPQKVQEIGQAIDGRGAGGCPMCHKRTLGVVGYRRMNTSYDANVGRVGGDPLVVVICESCGFVMEFDLGTLGVTP